MKIIRIIMALCLTIVGLESIQAEQIARKVENVTILNLDGKDAQIPYWGEKNLLIFYVDPDRANMNQEFTYELEDNKRAEGDNLVGLGVINLKDAPFIPNRLARAMAKKRTEKNKALVLADQTRELSTEWELGDCNNSFVTIMINRDGEIVFLHKGEYTEDDKEEFYKYIDMLK